MYSEPSRTSTMETFTKIGFQLLITFVQSYILDVFLGSGYFSGVKVNKITKGFHSAVRYSKDTASQRH